MFKLMGYLVMLTLPVAAPTSGNPSFSFLGISLGSNFDQVAKRYGHSTRVGSYIYVAPQDSHDHISGIEISGAGASRRVRVSFGLRREGQAPEYPKCEQVQAKIEQRFGPPGSIEKFSEEASRRADRVWRSPTEVLRLICHAGPRGVFAEAVQINPR